MKIQCACGAKYEILVRPGMPPVQFVCASCGQDYSAFVNDLIQQELGEGLPVAALATPQVQSPIPPQPSAAPVPPPPPPQPAGSRLKISAAHAATSPAAVPLPGSQIPLRKNTDELFATEKKFWRKTAWIFWTTAMIAVFGIGGWTWYAWFGAVPHAVFSAQFDDISHSGATFVVSNQLVLLHGGTLARYDLNSKKQIWSQELVTKQQIADALKAEDEARVKYEAENGRPEFSRKELPSVHEKHMRIALEEELSLRVDEKNISVARGDELTHYDWDSGKMLEQTTRTSGLDANAGKNRNSAQSQNGLPVSPYGDASQPLDAQKVNEQAQNLTLPGRIALPALIAGNVHQQQIAKELNSDNPRPKNSAEPHMPEEDFMTVSDGNGTLQFSAKLVEAHMVEREAMKAPPQKALIDSGNLTTANEGEAVNEQLNEMQRNNGSTVTEDQSIYQVTVRKPGSPDAAFTTNVVGQPQLFPLETVNVIAGNKTLIVLDKLDKKLWQAEMAYNIPAGLGTFLKADSGISRGPCVERDDTLYVYDDATLTAFDISNGNVRWRLPSIGINGLFFDEDGMLYVNTSTASLDSIKYAKQIDINNPTQGIFMKVDPKTGQTLWSVKPRGNIAYMSGKYIYTFTEFDPGDSDEQNDPSGIYRPPFLCIQRINPKNGKIMWEYTDDHAPVNVQYDRNNIRIVYKKEVRLLHYLSF